MLLALIILVSMTIAGIGMMRSVDVTLISAGNIAFRKSSLNASDIGHDKAYQLLSSLANGSNTADKLILDNGNGVTCPPSATASFCPGGNSSVPGYASTPLYACEITKSCTNPSNYLWYENDANWVNAPTSTITDPANGGTLATVNYLIHRMCQQAGSSNGAGQLCQVYTQPATGCSKTQLLPCNSTSLFYRVTTRSKSGRNATSYTQTFVMISS